MEDILLSFRPLFGQSVADRKHFPPHLSIVALSFNQIKIKSFALSPVLDPGSCPNYRLAFS